MGMEVFQQKEPNKASQATSKFAQPFPALGQKM